MIKNLSSEHKPLVVDFAYQRERENLFVIGSFKKHDDTLCENDFWGYFEGDHLVGLATFFIRWGSFVVNAQDPLVIEALTDEAIRANRTIEYVPCFKQYADVIVRRLQTQHGISPKELTEEVVMVLNRDFFVDFSTGDESVATPDDIDAIIRFDRIIENEPVDSPIQEYERKRINPDENFYAQKRWSDCFAGESSWSFQSLLSNWWRWDP
ncbi:hypothetical protein IPJ72_06875 [Candidatus Peregrinibacteria bacterium]|nr:MAG: hypothetical protein IPJ72_06875 [Candidatus Peregrinibacteria bacterium]